jgi:hypothetical protein
MLICVNNVVDLQFWLRFFLNWTGVNMFYDSNSASNCDMQLYTDASSTIGFGGLYQGKWFCSPWPDELPSLNDKTYLWLFSNFIKSWWLLSYRGPNGNVRKFFFIVTMKQLLG